MQLKISHLLPTYFSSEKAQQSEVWGKELVFAPGDRIKLVAPSGSGKSSLINFLYGMRNEYNGDIFYDGKKIKDMSVEETGRYRKDHISIVFQDLRLFPDQSAGDNLEIKRQLNPYHPPEKILEMADRLGVRDRLTYKASTCSYGEQQRLAIIRSLLQPFNFLLLDEPFSHLDSINAQKAMDLMLEEAAARNACILFADLERIDYYPHTRLFHL